MAIHLIYKLLLDLRRRNLQLQLSIILLLSVGFFLNLFKVSQHILSDKGIQAFRILLDFSHPLDDLLLKYVHALSHLGVHGVLFFKLFVDYFDGLIHMLH